MFDTKANKKALFNRIFSIAGLTVGGAILAALVVHVFRTMDVRALLRQTRPLWLVGAALCVPVSESIDALIFYGMGKGAGCPMRLTGCFDAAYIGEFYYKLGPAGMPVQLKLMYDAGLSATYTASIYTWKLVANTVVYTVYALAALAYKLVFHGESIGPAVIGAAFLIVLYVALCTLAVFTAIRPAPIQRLIRRILEWLSRHTKVMAKPGRVEAGMGKVDEFCRQLADLRGNKRLLAGLFAAMFLELGGPVRRAVFPLSRPGTRRALLCGAAAGTVPGDGHLPDRFAARQRGGRGRQLLSVYESHLRGACGGGNGALALCRVSGGHAAGRRVVGGALCQAQRQGIRRLP